MCAEDYISTGIFVMPNIVISNLDIVTIILSIYSSIVKLVPIESKV